MAAIADPSARGQAATPTKAPNFAWIPWLLYIVGAASGYWQWALAGGALAMLVVVAIEYRHRAVKIVDCTSLGFFIVMLAATLAIGQWIIAGYNVLIVWTAFAVVFWTTIAIAAPFSLQYARERAPSSVWRHPIFIRTNYRISLLWAVIGTINALLGLAMLKSPHPIIVGVIAPTVLMVFAYAAGDWYGKRVSAKFEDKIAAETTLEEESHG
jgi:hypothetical protein